MTRRPHLDDRDPAEPTDWHETSSPGMRRFAIQQTEAAVRAARDKRNARTNRVTAGHVDDAQEEQA